METKTSIRKEMLLLRSKLSKEQRAGNSAIITNTLLNHPLVCAADTVLAYASYQSEVSTGALLEELLQLKKKVFLPRVQGRDMEFYRIYQMSDIAPGYKGIPEPKEECCEMFTKDMDPFAIMLLPGVAFDASGVRLGYGMGFYDRYLEKQKIQHRIGIGFSCQCIASLPKEAYDKKVQLLITEAGIQTCS